VTTDRLGNRVCRDVSTVGFGADFTAPTGSLTAGPANNTSYNAIGSVGTFQVTASDNASGFSANPLSVIVTRSNPAASNTCVVGTVVSQVCTAAAQGLSFDPTAGVAAPTREGYYNATITLLDQAGNSTTIVTGRVFGLDEPAAIAPNSTAEIGFTGGISLPSVIAGAATNSFTATPVEDLDLASVFGVTAYPTGNLQYPSQSLGAFGTPFERGGAAIQYAVPNWIRCLNPAGDFATTTNKPTAITLNAVDQAGNVGSLTSGAFGANAETCGAVGAVTPLFFGNNGATALTVAYGTGKTAVDIDGATVATTSATSVGLTVIADVPLNSSVNPFQRVDFYYQNAAGNLVLIGSGSATLAQTQTNRTYTYAFTRDPDALVQVGNVNIVAIGIDSQGDAVMSNALGAVQVVTVQ
jgi:hypothetical protein